MPTAKRIAKTLSLEKQLLHAVERTKGRVSTSERVNQLLRAGLEAESRRQLDCEAAEFFSAEEDRSGPAAFQTAALKAIARK